MCIKSKLWWVLLFIWPVIWAQNSDPADSNATNSGPANSGPANSENIEAQEEETNQPGQSSTRWYRSNQLAMKLGLLDDPRLIGQELWGIEEEQNDQQRLRNLYFRGQLQETWLLTYRNGKPFQEQHKKGGVLLENRFYDAASGLLSENTRYADDGQTVEERLLFFYDDSGNVTRSMIYDQQGDLVSESNYYLGAVGQLVKLNIKMFSNNQEVTQYQLNNLNTLVQYKGKRKKYQVNLYNSLRQNTSHITYLNEEIQERVYFSYSLDRQLQKTTVTAKDRVEEYDYNSQEKLTQKQVWQDNTLFETELYRYDVLGRLVNKSATNWKSNEKNEERYTYQGQSTDPQKIEFYLGKQIDKIRIYSSLYEYSEELYFNGVFVAKVFYSYDDERSNEVTFENPPEPEAYDEVMEQ